MPACPRCGSHSVSPRGSAKRPGRFQCDNCHKHFTDRGAAKHKGPGILSLDVETLPLKFYGFAVWGQDIRPHQIIQDWSLLSYAAKWVGDDNVISGILTPEEIPTRNDKRISSEIWQLLDRAQVVITHNGKRFDIKKIQTRFWKHGLHKPGHYRVIDTLVAAKSVFGLTYNSMDFIAKYIERDEKLDTDFSLWARADQADPEALGYMREYNEQDVITQDQIYMSMREWIPNHPNLTIYNGQKACPVCLHKHYKPIGIYTTNKKKYKEYRCNQCGSTWHNSKALKG
jgi:transposase-like protein